MCPGVVVSACMPFVNLPTLSSSLSGCFFALQEVCSEDIPIMLVGNKCDLRKDGVNSVPTSYGEKLAMVTLNAAANVVVLLIPAFFPL